MKSLFKKQELVFIGWFAAIFLGTEALLAGFCLLPDELIENTDTDDSELAVNNLGRHSAFGILHPDGAYANPAGGTSTISTTTLAYPIKLTIPAIQVDTVVKNPTSTSTATLDAELKKGAVRYPGSGTLGIGNMFIFGHSTSHAIVQNKAYKVFNNIKNLKAGDSIYLESGTKVYEYRVRDVHLVDKNQTLINFQPGANMLTLSTCNSFGERSDRYVVQADFAGVR
jgi:LPXTG-site transpeptidase (sortase) family protein